MANNQNNQKGMSNNEVVEELASMVRTTNKADLLSYRLTAHLFFLMRDNNLELPFKVRQEFMSLAKRLLEEEYVL